jgi:uncharacterized membrane protein
MSTPRPQRLWALDALRGLLVAFMALDHASGMVAQKHVVGEMWGGRFPVYHDALSFLTRLVTHPCAPGFFFLMGAGMTLMAQSRRAQGATRWSVSRHLLLRGLLVVALKLLVVNRAWELSPGGWGIGLYIGVLFAAGANMILGSALVWLKPWQLAALTLALTLGMEWFTPAPEAWGASTSVARLLLLVPGGLYGPQGATRIWANYPVLPWLKLVTFGMWFGHWLARDAAQAFSRAWKLGLALLALFVIVRALDGFGNIRPRAGDDWIAFLNLVKYPPSLAYTLLTMGINLVLLGLLGQTGTLWQRVLHPLIVFGQTPLFFYVLHLFLYAGMGHLLTPRGTSLLQMYPLWLLGLLVLYPLCLRYGRLKRKQSPDSILRML